MRAPGDVLYNFHWIVPGKAARSAQAYAGFLGPFLARHGIKSVANLRGENPGHLWWKYEKRVCEKRGVAHYDVKLNSRQLPKREMLTALVGAFDAAPKPMLIKCSGGQDRTSLAAALYLIHLQGWSAFDEAMAQFAGWPYLHWPRQHQRWLKQLPFYAREASNGAPLADWLAQKYDPMEFKSWLEARGLGQTFRKVYGHGPRLKP